jgi:RNA polymerase sigma factor (sigma-70 family)
MNTEEQVLRDFMEGSEFAFTSIYNSYADKLLSYGTGLGFGKEILEDAIQDVFVKLYFNRKQLEEVNNLKFYLFRSLKNRLLDIQKTTIETSDIDHYEVNFSIKTTILDELIAEEDKIDIQNKVNLMLGCLTSRQREAIYLRFIHEMEYEEIGKLLEMTPQAARKLVSRGIGRIREKNLILYFIIFVLSN